MAMNKYKSVDPGQEKALGQNPLEQKKESLAESVVAKVRKGLEEIEARPGEYFYYPFNYNLIFDLEKYLKIEETRDAALKLVIQKKNLIKKIYERIKYEVKTKQMLASGENTRKLQHEIGKEEILPKGQNEKIIETLEKLIQIGENK